MLTDFYVAFATVCFTLLGLWIIVVQTRHADWRRLSVHRRRAYGVALHFSLPGVMGLLSLIDPASTALWRISFAIAAGGGVIVLVLVRGPAPTWLGLASYLAAVLLYALIALVAIAPSVVADLGISARPLRVEAVLLTIVVFLGRERRLAAAVRRDVVLRSPLTTVSPCAPVFRGRSQRRIAVMPGFRSS